MAYWISQLLSWVYLLGYHGFLESVKLGKLFLSDLVKYRDWFSQVFDRGGVCADSITNLG